VMKKEILFPIARKNEVRKSGLICCRATQIYSLALSFRPFNKVFSSAHKDLKGLDLDWTKQNNVNISALSNDWWVNIPRIETVPLWLVNK
jgi:hypothetical protein